MPRNPDREAIFHPEFRRELRYWIENDRKVGVRAFDLIEDVLRDPFAGVGKPEALKYVLAGCWSRRITQEHRRVHRVSDRRVDCLQARYHHEEIPLPPPVIRSATPQSDSAAPP